MISIEEDEKKPGYVKRIKQIKEIKSHYEMVVKMDKREKIFDDDTMNKLIKECEEKQKNTKIIYKIKNNNIFIKYSERDNYALSEQWIIYLMMD